MKKIIYLAVVLVLLLAFIGYYYFPDKFGLSPSFVVTSEPECGDGFDNDGDGEADFPDDLECFASWDISESLGGRCNEDWSCTQWSSCSEGKQKRTCVDANECETIEKRPLVERECKTFLEEPKNKEEKFIYLIIAGFVVLVLIIFLIVNRVMADRDKEKIRENRKVLTEKLKRTLDN
ncbi:hypothetical protein J4462_00855 [Candidatus Pacearchaeota archaeon]|nr:hypothetical protein [Candidatus Pacearchaeota archaeon]